MPRTSRPRDHPGRPGRAPGVPAPAHRRRYSPGKNQSTSCVSFSVALAAWCLFLTKPKQIERLQDDARGTKSLYVQYVRRATAAAAIIPSAAASLHPPGLQPCQPLLLTLTGYGQEQTEEWARGRARPPVTATRPIERRYMCRRQQQSDDEEGVIIIIIAGAKGQEEEAPPSKPS